MNIFSDLFKKPNIKYYKIFDTEEEANKTIILNKAVTVQIENTKICLARTNQGFFAVQNTCPHLGDSLSRGVCNNFGEIVCPWHSYRFNLQTGEETTGKNLFIKQYSVEIRSSGLYIGV